MIGSFTSCYNIRTNQWIDSSNNTTVAADGDNGGGLPINCIDMAIAIDTSTHRLFCFGGQRTDGKYMDCIQCYNQFTNKWVILKTKLHVARSKAVACYVPHMRGVFIFGGYGCPPKDFGARSEAKQVWLSSIEFYALVGDKTCTMIPEQRWCCPITYQMASSVHIIDNSSYISSKSGAGDGNGIGTGRVLLVLMNEHTISPLAAQRKVINNSSYYYSTYSPLRYSTRTTAYQLLLLSPYSYSYNWYYCSNCNWWW
jgi:hypothetical protein